MGWFGHVGKRDSTSAVVIAPQLETLEDRDALWREAQFFDALLGRPCIDDGAFGWAPMCGAICFHAGVASDVAGGALVMVGVDGVESWYWTYPVSARRGTTLGAIMRVRSYMIVVGLFGVPMA